MLRSETFQTTLVRNILNINRIMQLPVKIEHWEWNDYDSFYKHSFTFIILSALLTEILHLDTFFSHVPSSLLSLYTIVQHQVTLPNFYYSRVVKSRNSIMTATKSRQPPTPNHNVWRWVTRRAAWQQRSVAQGFSGFCFYEPPSSLQTKGYAHIHVPIPWQVL